MKKSRLIALLSALMVLAAMVVVVGCGSDDDSSSGSGDFQSELITEGTLTVGSDIPYAPFEFGKAPDYTGFDVDLVNEIASKLDLEVKIEDTAFDTIFTDVAQGKFDMVASAATITPEREQAVNFSDPYFESEQALLVPPGSDITSVEDLSGATVAAQDGTTGEAYANDETDAGQVRGFPTGAAAIAAVVNGQAEAAIIDAPVAEDAASKGQGGFEIATNIPTGEYYGFAFAKDTPELLSAVNGALSDLIEDGTYEELFRKYFKATPPASITDGTAAADTGTTE
ncbi:MAG: basic amino acid ABC transporter substrate-binding protein [Solirubrobacterales bacterium]|nr:basic amino acid ABC transporter substrate-binding protein [Solirubrobacterales bacterium]